MVQSQENYCLKIGQVAKLAEVSIDTVRYYERRGVLPPPTRLPSGYRLYNHEDVNRLRLARNLREVGFTVDEVADGLAARDHGARCADEIWRLAAVRDRLGARITALTTACDQITKVIDQCAKNACDSAPAAKPPV
jgi:DNA-binding transcriptional MerR regulator